MIRVEKVRKPAFLRDSIEYMVNDGRVDAFIYFNIDKPETGGPKEWAIDTPQSIKAYSESLDKYEQLFRSVITTE